MSHTASIKGIKIQSISALTSALAELTAQGIKCSLTANAKPRAYFPDQPGMGLADFVINLPEAKYDIGLYKQPDGSYEPRTDFFGGSIERMFGVKAADAAKTEQAKLGKLFQMYGIHAATETARRQGKTVRRIQGQEGKVKLVVSGF